MQSNLLLRCFPTDVEWHGVLLFGAGRGFFEDFKAVDLIYSAWLPGLGVTPLPARTAFAALSLPAGALVMMDVVAAFPIE